MVYLGLAVAAFVSLFFPTSLYSSQSSTLIKNIALEASEAGVLRKKVQRSITDLPSHHRRKLGISMAGGTPQDLRFYGEVGGQVYFLRLPAASKTLQVFQAVARAPDPVLRIDLNDVQSRRIREHLLAASDGGASKAPQQKRSSFPKTRRSHTNTATAAAPPVRPQHSYWGAGGAAGAEAIDDEAAASVAGLLEPSVTLSNVSGDVLSTLRSYLTASDAGKLSAASKKLRDRAAAERARRLGVFTASRASPAEIYQVSLLGRTHPRNWTPEERIRVEAAARYYLDQQAPETAYQLLIKNGVTFEEFPLPEDISRQLLLIRAALETGRFVQARKGVSSLPVSLFESVPASAHTASMGQRVTPAQVNEAYMLYARAVSPSKEALGRLVNSGIQDPAIRHQVQSLFTTMSMVRRVERDRVLAWKDELLGSPYLSDFQKNEIRYRLGELYAGQANAERAIHYFEQVAENTHFRHPRHIDALNELINQYIRNGVTTDRSVYQKMLEQAHANLDRRTLSLAHVDDSEAAIKAYRSSLKGEESLPLDDRAKIHFQLGRAYYQRHQNKQAIYHMRRVLQEENLSMVDFMTVRRSLADAYLATESPEMLPDVIELLKQVLKDDKTYFVNRDRVSPLSREVHKDINWKLAEALYQYSQYIHSYDYAVSANQYYRNAERFAQSSYKKFMIRKRQADVQFEVYLDRKARESLGGFPYRENAIMTLYEQLLQQSTDDAVRAEISMKVGYLAHKMSKLDFMKHEKEEYFKRASTHYQRAEKLQQHLSLQQKELLKLRKAMAAYDKVKGRVLSEKYLRKAERFIQQALGASDVQGVEHVRAYERLGLIRARYGAFEEAEAAYTGAIEAGRGLKLYERFRAYKYRAEAAAAQGKFQSALDDYNAIFKSKDIAAATMDRDIYDAMYLERAKMHIRLGNAEQALEELNQFDEWRSKLGLGVLTASNDRKQQKIRALTFLHLDRLDEALVEAKGFLQKEAYQALHLPAYQPIVTAAELDEFVHQAVIQEWLTGSTKEAQQMLKHYVAIRARMKLKIPKSIPYHILNAAMTADQRKSWAEQNLLKQKIKAHRITLQAYIRPSQREAFWKKINALSNQGKQKSSP